jgi:hypothetical protein
VVQEGKAYRFYAVKPFFRQLEDRVFDNPESARIAALALSPLRHKPGRELQGCDAILGQPCWQ